MTIVGIGQRSTRQRLGREGLHRAATLASGAEVTGAPALSSGMVKLYLTRLIPSAAVGSGIFRDRTIGDIALGVDSKDLLLAQFLEKIAQAQNDDLVADDKQPPVHVMQSHGVQRTAQTEDDVTPALPARGAMIELAQMANGLGLSRIVLLDAPVGQAIEDAKFSLAQPLVDFDGRTDGSQGSFTRRISAVAWART